MSGDKIVFKPKMKGKILSNVNAPQARKVVGPLFKPNTLMLWEELDVRKNHKKKIISAYIDTPYIPYNTRTGKPDPNLEMQLTLGVEMEFCANKELGCRWYQNIKFFSSYIGNRFKKDMKVTSEYNVPLFTTEKGKAVNMKGGMNMYLDASKLLFLPTAFSASFTAQNGKITFKMVKKP